VVTNQQADPEAAEFIAFLEDEMARKIFESEGWSR
jgi:accessory colonization factor AcfC